MNTQMHLCVRHEYIYETRTSISHTGAHSSHGLINNPGRIWIQPRYDANGSGSNPVCFHMDTLQRRLVFYIMAFTSDKNTVFLLLVWSWGVLVRKRNARRCRLVRVADRTRSYTNESGEAVGHSGALRFSQVIKAVKSKDSTPENVHLPNLPEATPSSSTA